MGAGCSSSASIKRSYDDLPPELLDLVIARLPDLADRARARAVCRSWHSAVRRHGRQPWRLPSTISNMRRHRRRGLPRNANYVGSTDDWLAVRIGKEHKYLLHNPFFNRTVPLIELEAVLVHDDHESIIYKFLMRSGVDDFTAVITNSLKYPFMVIWPGKGVWLPKLYMDIIDFAFLQGKLYAITNTEDLFPFDLALDGEARPVVTMGTRLIKQPTAPLTGITYLHPNCYVRLLLAVRWT